MSPFDCDIITNIEVSRVQREVLERWLALSLPADDEPIKDEIRDELKARDEAEAAAEYQERQHAA